MIQFMEWCYKIIIIMIVEYWDWSKIPIKNTIRGGGRHFFIKLDNQFWWCLTLTSGFILLIAVRLKSHFTVHYYGSLHNKAFYQFALPIFYLIFLPVPLSHPLPHQLWPGCIHGICPYLLHMLFLNISTSLLLLNFLHYYIIPHPRFFFTYPKYYRSSISHISLPHS